MTVPQVGLVKESLLHSGENIYSGHSIQNSGRSMHTNLSLDLDLEGDLLRDLVMCARLVRERERERRDLEQDWYNLWRRWDLLLDLLRERDLWELRIVSNTDTNWVRIYRKSEIHCLNLQC